MDEPVLERLATEPENWFREQEVGPISVKRKPVRSNKWSKKECFKELCSAADINPFITADHLPNPKYDAFAPSLETNCGKLAVE